MPDALNSINMRHTPQNERADARQVENSASGFVFTVDDETRLARFLTLGTEGGTYYVGQDDLTKDNANFLIDLIKRDPKLVVDKAVEVSQAGRAPKNSQALFALAAVAGLGDEKARKWALLHLDKVARTGTHLFQFASYVEQFRGWGRGLRNAVAEWYLSKDPDKLAYQLLKYRQREGWSHRDLLRLSHPKPLALGDAHAGLFDYVTHRHDADEYGPTDLPKLVHDFEQAQASNSTDEIVGLINTSDLSWEMLPDWALSRKDVWRALVVKGMPQTALMRQLPRLTKLEVIKPMSTITKSVADQLRDTEKLMKGRVHPVNVLIAQATYAQGRGVRGSMTWQPNQQIVDALDEAFYNSFGAVEPTGKRMMLALDVSGSMGAQAGGTPLSCMQASAALAMVTARTEEQYEVVAFGSRRGWTAGGGRASRWMRSGIEPMSISPRQRIDDVLRAMNSIPFGGTDCALPMLYAKEKRIPVDMFTVYTDSETWAGGVHPHQALRDYRSAMGIDARLVVVGMTSSGFSIADPDDAGMLDVAGFDSAVPQLISDFARGDL